MSREGEGGRLKKNNCCLTCSIISFILLIAFIAALLIGGNILFKQYVSPKIGGVGLFDSMSLARKILFGKETKASYNEEDLDDFYSELSSSLFMSDKSEEELEYSLLSDDAKASLDVTSAAESEEPGAGEVGSSETSAPSYDNDAAYAAFLLLSKNARYDLLTDDMKELCSLEEFGRLASSESESVRKRLGLKLYRLSINGLLGNESFSPSDFSSDKLTNQAFDSIDFNFETLADYDISDPSAPENTKFTTFSVEGKQVSAFINDILNFFLSADVSSFGSEYASLVPSGKNLSDYIKIANVTIKNSPILVSGTEALYNQKDTELGITISLRLRDLIQEMMNGEEVRQKLDSAPSFTVSAIPKIIPKYLSVSAFVYPLAEDEDKREIRIKVNKMSDKDAKNLSSIVNGLRENNSSEPIEKSFFRDLNDKVVSTFKKINDKVKINFVPSVDKDGKPLKDSSGKTYSELQIMTIETLISLLNKSESSLSAHDIFTVLKCLYVTESKPSALSLGEAMTSFKSEVASKYGVDLAFLNENNLLSPDALDGFIEHIHLSDGIVDFTKSNEQMQVELPAETLAALLMELLSETGDESVAAAEEEPSAKNILKGLDPDVCSVVVESGGESGGKKIYSIELLISLGLSDLLSGYMPTDEQASKLVKKILPKGKTYFGVKLFVSEETVEGKLVHKAGKNISSGDAYATMFRINDFTYAETANVIQTINTFMKSMGSESGFDISSVTGSIEDAVTDLFNKLQERDYKISVRLFGKNSSSKGGLMLPSIYELVESLVAPRLEGAETFTSADAQQILALVYDSNANKSVTFSPAQADDLLDDVNDKFYISHDSALAASDLFGEGTANLSDKINANSIYFKSSEEEQNKWGAGYIKTALFDDTRSIDDLRIGLTGGEIAALIDKLNLMPTDLSSSFGEVTILGANFKTENRKTYLSFDVLCTFVKNASSSESVNLSVLFPHDIKVSFEILMFADSYSEEAPRFSSKLLINDSDVEKVFTLLKAFGGGNLSATALSDKIKTALSPVFTSLEEKIPVYYSNAGFAYTTTISGKTENCIYLADVFTALIGLTNIKDTIDESTGAEIPEENRTQADAALFRAKLMEFGRMPSYNLEGESSSWSVDVSGITDFFTDDDLDSFLASLKSNYYLNSDLTAENIMGDHASFDVNASSVSFPSMYADERPVSELSVPLTGNALGALVKQTLGVIEMGEDGLATLVQSAVRLDTNETVEKTDDKFLLDLAFLVRLTGTSNILPTHIFVKAEIDLSYDFVNDCFPADLSCTAKITINNLTDYQTKNMFGYISVLGGSISMNTISDNVAQSLEDGIKKMLNLYPDGTVTVSEDAIVLPDVFTFLINLTNMSNASADSLASRLRGFGYQMNANGDPENEADYSWVQGLKLFLSTDDMYVYTNMQRAYFMKEKPDMESIYGGVGNYFTTIDDTNFNLTGADGLYHYDGAIKTLKISDKALGVMIKSKQSFAAAVSSGVTASLESVRIFLDGGDLRLESGIKVTLGNDPAYAMLPKYFFVKALTQEDPSALNGYSTAISVNNLSRAETVAFFTNFTSLSTVGVNNTAFNITNLEREINKAVGAGLNSFTSSVTVTYGTFTAADISGEYNATNYPGDQISVHEDDGYAQIPSVYAFLIDLLYTSNKPAEAEMQHMLNKLYEEESSLENELVTNPADNNGFNGIGYRGDNGLFDRVSVYSDNFLADKFNTELSGSSINDDPIIPNDEITISSIRQAIIIRAGDTAVQDVWRDKFFAQGSDFSATHNYMIATVVADLSNYSSGSSTSLVPSSLWFTVLIDLTDRTESRGLLYDMNETDMNIFEHILSSNNARFDIDVIAIELADIIIGKINMLTYLGTVITYYSATDTYYYADTTPFNDNKRDISSEMTGNGYIVVSYN